MTAPRAPAPPDRLTIAGFPAVLTRVAVLDETVALYTVPELEHLVDRAALLRGEGEPPYWAHLWTGARWLARYLLRWHALRGARVLDVGCGLGLCGLAAARRGARVLCVDAAAPAIEFVGASALVNGCVCDTVCGDYRTLDSGLQFDVVVAAEVAYDPATFASLADAFVRHLAPGGIGLLADGFRTDTRPLYRELVARPLIAHGLDFMPPDDGRPAAARLTCIRHV